jgi:NADPH:quinone reductase-like Zn-dependent oxidoreductase
MKAWICKGNGGPEVLALEDRPVPVPGDDEVLVKIHATTVASGDVRVRAFKLPHGFGLIGRLVLGITGPRQPIMGTDMAGTVVAIGKHVKAFKIGDAVMAFAGAAMRCHAQYRVMSVNRAIALKPDNLSFEEAASLPFGATTALHFLRKAQFKAGEKILVIGASGAVGSAFVQLARHMGAEVTGVTSSRNVSLVRSLGAHAVVDYTVEDFTQAPPTYDIIADTVGASAFAACRAKLNEHGRYISVAGGLSDLLARPAGTKKSIGGPASERADDLRALARLAESGALKPVIDRTYGFQHLPEAHAYVETGRKRGSVVVSSE